MKMQKLRIVKTLETVLARFTRCGMFLARFYNACLRESLHSKMKKRDAVSVCKECLMMLELRVVKTLETVLARFTRCELFLARFYDARLRESLHSKMKKRDAVSVCTECLMMHGHRIAKTLETVLARFTRCELFLACFYDARSRESLHSKMKKRDAVSVCKECLMMLELRVVKNTRNGPRSLHSLRIVSRTFLRCSFARIIAFQDEKKRCSFRLQGMLDDAWTSHCKNTRNGPRSL